MARQDSPPGFRVRLFTGKLASVPWPIFECGVPLFTIVSANAALAPSLLRHRRWRPQQRLLKNTKRSRSKRWSYFRSAALPSQIRCWLPGLWQFALLFSPKLRHARYSRSPAAYKIFGNGWLKACIIFLENIIGRELVAKGFWYFATIFIFILFVNWLGLIPGIGTVGWGHYDPSGNFVVDRPLLRGGNADLNMTTAMSAIFS